MKLGKLALLSAIGFVLVGCGRGQSSNVTYTRQAVSFEQMFKMECRVDSDCGDQRVCVNHRCMAN